MHKNKSHLQQRTYIAKKKASQTPVESIFSHWEKALAARKRREKLSDNIFIELIQKGSEIKEACISSQTDPSEFQEKLDSLCKKHNITPVRKNNCQNNL